MTVLYILIQDAEQGKTKTNGNVFMFIFMIMKMFWFCFSFWPFLILCLILNWFCSFLNIFLDEKFRIYKISSLLIVIRVRKHFPFIFSDILSQNQKQKQNYFFRYPKNSGTYPMKMKMKSDENDIR